MSNAQQTLDRWQAFADGATEGPWTVTYEHTEGECGSGGEPYAYAIQGPADHSTLDTDWLSDEYKAQYGHQMTEVVGLSDEDAEFIAAARTIVPAAVKALRDVLDELDQWERSGHLSIEMVHVRDRIETALDGEGR